MITIIYLNYGSIFPEIWAPFFENSFTLKKVELLCNRYSRRIT